MAPLESKNTVRAAPRASTPPPLKAPAAPAKKEGEAAADPAAAPPPSPPAVARSGLGRWAVVVLVLVLSSSWVAAVVALALAGTLWGPGAPLSLDLGTDVWLALDLQARRLQAAGAGAVADVHASAVRVLAACVAHPQATFAAAAVASLVLVLWKVKAVRAAATAPLRAAARRLYPGKKE